MRSIVGSALALLFVAVCGSMAHAQDVTPYAPVPEMRVAQPRPGIETARPYQFFGGWSHYNSDYNSTNLRNEVLFIFGNSRSFFNEPYFKGKPPNAPCTNGGCGWR